MNHNDLTVWQASVELAVNIYSITKSFPADEKYGLTSQMRRSAVSISSNIAEGAARRSRKEFLQFLSIAAGSASELSTQLIISERIGYPTRLGQSQLGTQVGRVAQLIHGLIRSVEKREQEIR